MADVVTLGVEVKTTGAAQAGGELEKFSASAKKAAGASDQLEDMLRQQAAAQERLTSTARPVSGAMQSVGQAFSRNSSAIQNASFQLQDMVVQMSMGVPAARTLGMQLPQLLGGFGPLGAVVGLAVGALLSFAPAAFGAADSATTLEDALDKLDSAMQRLNAAQKTQSLQDLSMQYGAQEEAARELLDIQRQIAQIEADRAFRAASSAVVGALGPDLANQTLAAALENAMRLNKELADRAELERIISDVEAGRVTLTAAEDSALRQRAIALDRLTISNAEYRGSLQKITEDFGISEQAAANLAIAMAAVTQADTTEERVAATQNLAKAIDEATGGLNMASDEGIALYNALLDAALAGLDLKNLDLPSNLSSAAGEASRLADEMGRAASNAITMAAQSFSARSEAEIRLRYAGDPIGEARALAEQRFNAANPQMVNAPVGGQTFASAKQTYVENAVAAAEAQLALQELNKTLKGGGGGTTDAAREAQRLYESTRTEAEKYAAELSKVEQLYQMGAISGDTYARAVRQLNEQFDPFTQLVAGISNTVENELNSAFSDVLSGTETLGNALLDFASNVLQKVAQDLFAQQFSTPISQALTSVIGTAIGGTAAVPGSVAPPPRPFARGGVVHGATVFPFADGVGLMGEAGPEAIMPLSRGPDGRLGVAANGNGAPRITINNYSGQEATASTDSAGNVTIDIGRLVAQDITAGGPAYRAIKSTFGLSNRLQQRG